MKKKIFKYIGRIIPKRYFFLGLIAILVFITFISTNRVLADSDSTEKSNPSEAWKWTLNLDGKYTCTSTKVNAQHTDTHRGLVTFDMPDVSGKVSAKNGKYRYDVVGQTLGRPYQFSTAGKFTFTGDVIPGLLKFTPQVHLPDGRPFFQPVKTYEIAIQDGATVTVPPASNSEVRCTGPVTYQLKGAPREHYNILVDDRFLLVKDHGVWSGHTYRTGLTLQVLTEMEVMIEGNKVKKTSGRRRLGRLTPVSYPPLVWDINLINGKCKDGVSYPFVPELNNGQVSATLLGKTSVKLSAQGGFPRGAVQWKINPKQAKVVSPDIQYGKPEDFNGELCTEASLFDTQWTFPRRSNTTKTTQDSFDHLQTLYVTQETTAMGEAPGVSTSQQPVTKYFKGDVSP